MCGDAIETTGQVDEPPASGRTDEPPVMSRRGLLLGAAGAAAGTAVFGKMSSAEAAAVPGQSCVSMAMHIHSSFSEQTASMNAQLDQAQINDVNVLWWTDHDHRMQQGRYRAEVHFSSLTDEAPGGKAWIWRQQTTGLLTADSGGGVVDSPASPNDPVAAGSLSLTARSTSTTAAS